MPLPIPLRTCALALAVACAACAPASTEPRPVPVPGAGVPPASPSSSSLPVEAPPLARLPGDARPTRYALALRVDPAQARFSGVADIAVELDRPRDVIWLHGRDLAVRRATVQPEGAAALEARWEQVSKSGVASLRLASPVGPGRVTLHVEYDAPFSGNDEGLYVVARGTDHYAFTQFEATDARRAFPCFDEPGFKAPFELAVSVPHALAAVSNTRETSRAREPAAGGADWDRVTFAPTERLPSYLVALAVGPLDVVAAPDVPPSAVRPRPLPLRGVATRGRGKELAYALAHAGEIVTALEGYFGSAYPYDKLDLLAVPDMGGAMENAGAITFAEGILLLDEPSSSAEARFTHASVVAHEISHQWFGDLVTMRWWDDLWLNEAFATWMEARIVGKLRPDLRPDVHALESVHQAMNADSLVSARKIRQEIADDNDIESAFDAITYDKGGGVLSMFERWIGPEAFQKGVRGYLGAHRFGSASAEDLFASLSTAAGRDVAGPLRTFLDRPGLPFVEASVSCEGHPRLLLRQSRFFPLGSAGAGDGHTWQIPVCARYADGAPDPRGLHAARRARGHAAARERLLSGVGDAQRRRGRLLPLVAGPGRPQEARGPPARAARARADELRPEPLRVVPARGRAGGRPPGDAGAARRRRKPGGGRRAHGSRLRRRPLARRRSPEGPGRGLCLRPLHARSTARSAGSRRRARRRAGPSSARA